MRAAGETTPPADAADGTGTEQVMILWEVIRTAQAAERLMRGVFAAVALTPTQYGVLACLADGDDFTKTQLAQALTVRPQSIDPAVEDLITRGLVVRDRPPRRGRATGISITGLGEDLLGRVRPRLAATNAPAALGLIGDDVTAAVRVLRAIRGRSGSA